MEYIKKNTLITNCHGLGQKTFDYEASIVEIIKDAVPAKGVCMVRLVDGGLYYVPTNRIVKRDYKTIIYRYTLINGKTIEKQGNNLETIILNYRKKLKAHKKNRAQRNSLQYRFAHDLEFKSAS
tara:strand:- start:831 stop:1202 length:372 start_codon:yes stop_codon:yes gene_type:complete